MKWGEERGKEATDYKVGLQFDPHVVKMNKCTSVGVWKRMVRTTSVLNGGSSGIMVYFSLPWL